MNTLPISILKNNWFSISINDRQITERIRHDRGYDILHRHQTRHLAGLMVV